MFKVVRLCFVISANTSSLHQSVLSIFMHVLEIIFYSPVWVSLSTAKFKTAGKASRPRRRKMPSPASSYTTHRSMQTVPQANRKRLSLNGRASPAGPLLKSTRPGPNYTLYGNGPQTFHPMSSLASFSHAVTVTWNRLSSNFIRISIPLMKRNCYNALKSSRFLTSLRRWEY